MSRADSPWRDRVVFLVGARRSGTNWLHRIVDAHPDVVVIPGETYLFSHGLSPLAERVQHGLAGSTRTGFVFMERDPFLDATRDFCDRLFDGLVDVMAVPPGARIAERTPDHVRHLELIGAIYPDAWVVHIVRDGRDVARSLVSQSWGPQSVADAAEEWRSAVSSGRQAGASLGRYLELRYEDLLADPRGQTTRLFDWLELGADPAAVELALEQAGIRYNVDPSAPEVGAGKWRSSFTDDDVSAFEAVAGPLLDELGYSREAAVVAAPSGRPRRRRGGPLARVLRRPAAGDGSLERFVRGRLDSAYAVVDGFMADLTAGRIEDLAARFTPGARVRCGGTGGSGPWTASGGEAVRRVLDELVADRALQGRQVRSDVYPAVPSFTVATVYEHPDGGLTTRVLVFGVVSGSIAELGYIRV